MCQSRESRRASESGRLVPACHIIGQRMCGSLASECRSRNGATNKTRTCKTTPVSTISVRGPFVARWCGSVEQICTRRQCQQKCQQQCRASLIELSLLVALSQPRIKLRRVAGQCTASLVKARSGQVDARAPWCRLWRLRLHPWAGRGRGPVPCRRAPASVHLIEADQGLPPMGLPLHPPQGEERECVEVVAVALGLTDVCAS